MKEKLKIGILLNDFSVHNWEYQIIDRIMNSEYAELVFVISNNSMCSPSRGKKRTIAGGILALIEKVDRLVFKTKADYKLKIDISDKLEGIHLLDAGPVPGSDKSGFTEPVISQIRGFNPDIILKFGFHNLEGVVLKIPKYGIWTYSGHNCNDMNSPDPGFWEVIKKIPVTNPALGILKPERGGVEVIASSWESTCQYSININRDSISWRSAIFAPRIMNGLYQYGEDYLDTVKNRFIHVSPENSGSLSQVSPAEAIGCMFRYTGAVAKSIIKKLVFTDAFRWYLFYDINDGSDLFSSGYGNFKKLPSPDEVFWADPFVIADDDRYYIFVEEFIYRKNQAHISVLTLDKNGGFLNSQRIIERPYHMSYPFIFKIDNTYYMIPETCKNRTIELYKCTQFPSEWVFVKNIMENLSAVDTTLFHFNNKWWLFTAIDQTENISGCSVELFLFFTDDILSGKWENHPLNPIVSDIRSARPAGKIFIQDGKICRPSQNCSGRYGIGFNINHITKLTETEYEETVLSEVKPVWNNKLRGTHTLNFDKNFTIIDAYSFRKRISI